jgi:hypothetical protein
MYINPKTLLLIVASCLGLQGQDFWGAGINAQATSSPQPTGVVFYAHEVNAASGIWSDSEINFTVGKQNGSYRVQSTTSTGGEVFLRTFKNFSIYIRGNVGATTTGSTTGLSAIWGPLVIHPIGSTGSYIGFAYTKLATNAAQGQQFFSLIWGKK